MVSRTVGEYLMAKKNCRQRGSDVVSQEIGVDTNAVILELGIISTNDVVLVWEPVPLHPRAHVDHFRTAHGVSICHQPSR